MKKVLIANRGENDREAGVSTHRRACVAGCGEFAPLSFPVCAEVFA